MTVLFVVLAAAAGAAARYVVDAVVSDRLGAVFPYGTLLVNVLGSFAAGVVVALGAGRVVVGLGFLGSFTTFSTFAYETLWLTAERAAGLALVNVVANVALCVLAAWFGLAAAGALT